MNREVNKDIIIGMLKVKCHEERGEAYKAKTIASFFFTLSLLELLYILTH